MLPRGGGRLGVGGDPTSTCATAVVERGRGRLTRPAPSEGGGEGGVVAAPGRRGAVDPSQVQAVRHVRRSAEAEAVTVGASCRCVRTYTIKAAEAKRVRGRASMPPRAMSPPRTGSAARRPSF